MAAQTGVMVLLAVWGNRGRDGPALATWRDPSILVDVAAPIWDWQHEAQAVITLVGIDPTMAEPGWEAVQVLREFFLEKSMTRCLD